MELKKQNKWSSGKREGEKEANQETDSYLENKLMIPRGDVCVYGMAETREKRMGFKEYTCDLKNRMWFKKKQGKYQTALYLKKL